METPVKESAEETPVLESEETVTGEETTNVSEADTKAMLEMLGEKESVKEVPTEEKKIIAEETTKKDASVVLETPVKEVIETELQASLRRENELRALLNEMARTGGASNIEQVVPKVGEETKTTPQKVAEIDPYAVLGQILGPEAIKQFSDGMKKDISFLSQEQLDALIDKPALIIPALNEARRQSAQEVISIIPTIVSGMVESYMQSVRTASEFYEKNSDLAPYRDFTKVLFSQVQKQNQDKPIEEILTLTASEVRKRLNLVAPTAKTVPTKVASQKPNFPAGKTRSGKVSSDRGIDSTKKSQADYMQETLGLT